MFIKSSYFIHILRNSVYTLLVIHKKSTAQGVNLGNINATARCPIFFKISVRHNSSAGLFGAFRSAESGSGSLIEASA